MKRCKKCLNEYSGSCCPQCGEPDITYLKKKVKYTVVTLAAAVIFGIVTLLIRQFIF